MKILEKLEDFLNLKKGDMIDIKGSEEFSNTFIVCENLSTFGVKTEYVSLSMPFIQIKGVLIRERLNYRKKHTFFTTLTNVELNILFGSAAVDKIILL